jgi:hypothetical protein
VRSFDYRAEKGPERLRLDGTGRQSWVISRFLLNITIFFQSSPKRELMHNFHQKGRNTTQRVHIAYVFTLGAML